MKNSVLIFLFLFSIHISYGQIQSGTVVYKIDPPSQIIDTSNEHYEKLKDNEVAMQYLMQLEKNTINTLSHVKLNLLFNTDESIFQVERHMQNDNKLDIKNAIGATNTAGIYYNNIKENLYIHQLETMSNLFLIQSKYDDLDWKIHDETKQILGYTCLKATTNIVEPSREFPTTVWFAPDLPFPFGPKEFRGLPGLILAMDYNNYYFYADSIDLDKKRKNIKRPTKGTAISPKDYEIESSKIFGNMRPNKQ